MSTFWTLFYTPAIVAAWPTTLMLNTWANYADPMNKSGAHRRRTENRRSVATESSAKNVIPIRSAVTRTVHAAKLNSTDLNKLDNVVSIVDKHRLRKASKGLS